MTSKEKVAEILKRLYAIWPDPQTDLIYKTPWELLVATMLSAQTTDKLVNIVTPELFAKFPGPQSTSKASVTEIDTVIKRVNFHNNKAKNIKKAAEKVILEFNGNVPDRIEDLVTLPGVARKTANVVLGNAFGKATGIAVDTHVMRLSQQLGLTDNKDPVKIEKDLMEIVPREHWTNWTHLLINYGREYSPARKHVRESEILGDLCE